MEIIVFGAGSLFFSCGLGSAFGSEIGAACFGVCLIILAALIKDNK